MGIWETESWQWPDDSDDYIFLGRTALAVGGHLFSTEWTGNEPVQFGPDPDDLAAFARWGTVQRTIASACSAGKLRSFARGFHGGPHLELRRSCWNLERLWPRFDKGMLDLKNPFDDPHLERSSFQHWIFFEKVGVDRLTGSVPRRGRPKGTGEYDWPRFKAQASIEFQLAGGKLTEAQLTEAMLEWTTRSRRDNGGGWPKCPSPSSARPYVRAAMKQARSKK